MIAVQWRLHKESNIGNIAFVDAELHVRLSAYGLIIDDVIMQYIATQNLQQRSRDDTFTISSQSRLLGG
ncbi:hypothetical protein [Desulfosediminicola ganghwensis]|uniref:hypothetical protein n=1 Tax=Desulfosediminicola ganghwensis TaxID=2569540 RepID=UPI0010AC5B0E|nr:hypothetical protein [Desulfosediminicola ganghwensis]